MTEARIVLTAQDKTGAAFATAKQNLIGLQQQGGELIRRFGGVGAAITAAIGAASVKGAINAGDEIGKLSQKTGIGVETLSAFRLAADLANVSNETLAKGIKALSVNMVAAAGGSKAAQATFATLGVSFKNADGSLRKVEDVLGDVAETFKGFDSGAEKAALAAEVFGQRAGPDLIPLLNIGRQGIAEARKEAEQLGAVFGEDFAKSAEQFNDNLTRLGTAALGAKITLAEQLLPTLNSTLEAFVKNAKAAGIFKGTLLTLGQGAAQGLGFDERGRLEAGLAITEASIGRVRLQIDDLQDALTKEPYNTGFSKALADARAELLGLERDAKSTNDRLKAIADEKAAGVVSTGQSNASDDEKDEKRPKRTSTSQGVAPDQIALLRRQLEGRTQAISQNLQAEQDVLRFNEQLVDAVYRSGRASLEDNFRQQDELRQSNLEKTRRAAEETVQVEQQFQAALPKPRDAAGKQRNLEAVEASETRIQAARAKLAAAEQEFEQAAQLTSIERPQQREQLRAEVAAFEAALQDLVDSGRSRAGELADIAERTRAAERLLLAGGAAPAEAQQRAQAFGQLLEQQRQFNVARDEFARITDRSRVAEEALALAQEQGGTGLLESERQIFELRSRELEPLEKMLAVTRALALAQAQPQNQALADEVSGLELQVQQRRATVDPTKLRFDAAADNIGDAVADGFARAVVEGEKLSDIVNNLDRQIVAIVTQEVITKPLAESIGNILKGAGGQGLGQNIFSVFGLGGFTVPGFAGGQIQVGGAAGQVAAGAGQAAAATGLGAVATTATTITSPALAALGTTVGGVTAPALAGLGTTVGAAAVPALTALAGAATAASTALALISANQVGDAGGDALGAFITAAGFSDGGFTGNGGTQDVAGVVHGQEFVFNARAVQTLGVPALEGLQRSAMRGDAPGGQALLALPEPGALAAAIDAAGLRQTAQDSPTPLQRALANSSRVMADGGGQQDPDDPRAFAWEDVVRYHTGGIAGMKPDEVPAVLRRGEEILTEADPRHRDNGGASDREPFVVHNNFQISGPVSRETQQQIAARSARALQQVIARGSA